VTDYKELISNQITYYRGRAADYDEAWPEDRLVEPTSEIRQALRRFSPSGRVLELACGTGNWTLELVKYADQLVALDASLEMLAINTERLGHDSGVRYVQADVFSWQPDDRYDVVVFAHWLSHVPSALFEPFWSLIASCLHPTGRVFFVDELPHEMWSEDYVDDAQAIVRRRARNGTEHELVKVFWDPLDLENALHDIGWRIAVTGTGPLYWGAGHRIA
jgi:SAM-dependent methyltransferase